MTKSDFVRAHPEVSAADLVALAAKDGMRLSKQLVYFVRGSQAPAQAKPSPAVPAKRAPARLPKAAAPARAPTPAPARAPAHGLAKRGPGRPRKHPIAASKPAAPRRRPGRPRHDATGGLTAPEKELATLLLVVGLPRAEALLAGLKRSLGL